MTNYVQPGKTLTFIATADTLSSAGVLVGVVFGVSAYDVKATFEGEMDVVGVFDLPKATGAITAFSKVYWDNTAKNVTTTATNNTAIGVAILAAQSADATARVRLNGSF